MSNALAIAATTETLRVLLERVLPLTGISGLTVTTQPPDAAAEDKTKPRLNLFLYQAAANASWRNLDMPRQVRPGETGRPPLALNLHYLITAYGAGPDALSDSILGAAMSVLHDHPLLNRDEIVDELSTGPKPIGVRDQFERLRITPLPMGLDEMSKLWMVFQTPYRLSAAYEVTVVLIDSRPTPAPLPVLKRGKEDRGVTAVAGVPPDLRAIRLPRSQSAARLGEDIAILGEQLTTDATTVRFTSMRAGTPILLEPLAGLTPGEIAVHLPNKTEDTEALTRWAPGFYTVALVQARADLPAIVSNELPFALAPQVTLGLKTQTLNGEFKDIGLAITCEPRILAGQRVLLLFGEQQVEADTVDTPEDEPAKPTVLEFKFSVPKDTAGDFVVRLRVDGVDSIPVKYEGTPPTPQFDSDQTVSVT